MRHEGFSFYGLRSSDEGADTYLKYIFAGLSIILSARLPLHLPILSAKQPSHVRNTKRTFTEKTRTNQPHTKRKTQTKVVYQSSQRYLQLNFVGKFPGNTKMRLSQNWYTWKLCSFDGLSGMLIINLLDFCLCVR